MSAWRSLDRFDGRALRPWLYRIATNRCLNHVRDASRRPRASAPVDGGPSTSGIGPAFDPWWLEPIPDAMMFRTPEEDVTAKQSVRLAVMTALQELPARQRAVLILRDVVQFSAAEVAELLETTPAAVNSSLQRARAHLAELSPTEERMTEPGDARRRDLLDRYCAAFENADMAALTALLQEDVKLEMPPLPVWFAGRDTVLQFLAGRALAQPGDVVMIPTAANAQPAVAEYRRAADRVMRAHSIHVLTPGGAGIAGITVFLDPGLFSAFGLSSSR